MTTLTKTEIRWIITELEKAVFAASEEAEGTNSAAMEILKLKAMNLQFVADKLRDTIQRDSKRIAIS